MQVIDQDEPRQGIIVVLAEGDAPDEEWKSPETQLALRD